MLAETVTLDVVSAAPIITVTATTVKRRKMESIEDFAFPPDDVAVVDVAQNALLFKVVKLDCELVDFKDQIPINKKSEHLEWWKLHGKNILELQALQEEF